MHTEHTKRLLGAVACGGLLGVAAACHDFLSGPKLTENPNRPSASSADQRFIGVTVQTFAEFTGRYPLQLLPMYARQFAGVARQWQTYARYSGAPTENDADAAFIDTYARGGLVDIRFIQGVAEAAGNEKFQGIAEVYEGLRIGTAADLFGDIPYSEALTGDDPKLDPQAEVYAGVQTVLDHAITHLASGKGAGPTSIDFVYGNDAAKWTKAAHTLKARFLMHTSRAPGVDSNAVFQQVIAQAQSGIRAAADDWTAVFTATTGEQNLYYNFLNSRNGDIEPDQSFINTLNAGGFTTLLNQYFRPKTGCGTEIKGAEQGSSGGSCASELKIAQNTPMGIVTAAENEMLLAEAQFRAGQAPAALTTLNDYRSAVGEPTLGALAGQPLLGAILTEKYVHLYLNPEVYFDLLRNCFPNISIPAGAQRDYVPARLPYGFSERIANSNIPSVSAQPLANANFPKRTTDVFGQSCASQKDRP